MAINSPCRYGSNLHITSPNTKSRSSVPINVIGMHSTPNKMSEMAKFNRNTLVMVRIRRLWINVSMTNAFPMIAQISIKIYKMICIRMVVNHDDNDAVGVDVDKITTSLPSSPRSVTGIKLGALSFIGSSHVIAYVSDVVFIASKLSIGIIMLGFIAAQPTRCAANEFRLASVVILVMV